MNTEKLKRISESDYGSTYQGLADEYSDIDTFALVQLPLKDGLFHDMKKQSTQDAEGRTLLTPQRLIQLGLKGSIHSLIMLSAQLKQHDEELSMRTLFKTFYEKGNTFSDLLMARKGTLIRSLFGILNKDLDRLNKAQNNHELTGKQVLQVCVDINRISILMVYYEGELNINLNYDNFIHDITFLECEYKPYELKPFIEIKRMKQDELLQHDMIQHFFETKDTIIKQLENRFGNHKQFYKDDKFEHESDIKSDIVEYLVESEFLNNEESG